MIASGVQRSKHALHCAQHLAPMTVSSTGGRYHITEPWDKNLVSGQKNPGQNPPDITPQTKAPQAKNPPEQIL